MLALMLVTSTAVPRIRIVAPHGGESRGVTELSNPAGSRYIDDVPEIFPDYAKNIF